MTADETGIPLEKLRSETIQAIDGLKDLPTLPSVATRIISMANSPNVSIASLKKVIIGDPPLAAKIMEISNSAYFGQRIPPKSLEKALVKIGLHKLIVVCTSIGVTSSFDV